MLLSTKPYQRIIIYIYQLPNTMLTLSSTDENVLTEELASESLRCDYYDVDSVKSLFDNKIDFKYGVLHLNIHSLPGKISE